MSPSNFNLRVYGLLIRQESVLITYENRGGMRMVKFPGGGLEKGEGIKDCLIREFEEELNLEVTVGDFYYVNDFLQISAFNPKDQLLSFYYLVHAKNEVLPIIHSKEEGLNVKPGEQLFQWIPLRELDADLLTFPIDKVVAALLQKST